MRTHHPVMARTLMLLAMVLLWIAAHDFYVVRVNHQQQSLIHELQQGNHDLSWPLNTPSDLVSGFGGGWQWQSDGLQLDPQTAEISLIFNNLFIVPDLYGQMTFDWLSQSSETRETELLLEFSQADSDIFYYSPPIKLQLGRNQINFNQLKWSAKQGPKNRPLNWQDLPQLNTLVWRFSQPGAKPSKANLRHVKIPQTKVLDAFEQTAPLTAIFNNQLKYEWQSQRLNRQLNLHPPPVMRAYLTLSPWLLFSVAVLFLIVAVKIVQPLNHNQQQVIHRDGAIWVIVLVALMAALMQTKVLFIALERMPWLAIVAFLLPTALLIKRWIKPRNAAGWMWIITLVIAVGMFFVSDSGWAFIQDLPVYLVWALAQQVILGPLVSDYLHQKVGMSQISVVLLCGVLFALLHVPNQMLMLATFLGGMLWSYAWIRHQNIYANAVSHALLALLFYQSMPDYLLGSARVGLWF